MQSLELEFLPRPEHSARLAAIEWMDADGSRLEDDLGLGSAGGHSLESQAFERGFGHLLTALGFSSAWWPKMQVQKRSARSVDRPNADDNPDHLAFSGGDTHVLVVECSVGTPSKEKVEKLSLRGEQIRACLQKKVGVYNSPDVLPVLALARGALPAASKTLVEENHITVLDEADIGRIVGALKAGAAAAEVDALLPAALRPAYAALPKALYW